MAEQIFKKETTWGNENNFVGDGEITVTITLGEYRDLVKQVALKDYDMEKERKRTFEAVKKAQSYKDKLEALIEKLNGVEEEDDD